LLGLATTEPNTHGLAHYQAHLWLGLASTEPNARGLAHYQAQGWVWPALDPTRSLTHCQAQS